MTYAAIETKVLHPTEGGLGTRIKAVEMDIAPSKNRAIPLTRSWDYALDVFENHEKVAFELHLTVCTYVLNNSSFGGCVHDIHYGSTQKGYVLVSTLPKEKWAEYFEQ